MVNRVGQQLGNYHLLRVLGQGTFAAVYLGEHQYLERSAAIKVLHVQIEPARQESFRREARTIAQLDHPSIISVHDFGIEDQVPYLVMDYMPYGTLRQRFPKGSQLSYQQILTYVKQIASALDYAHQRRVIHRDIKPENLLLNSKGEVVLSDFGIAVVQHTMGSLSIQNPAGTPVYMAPEQIQLQPRAASDQYALGVMVYEWLCGEPPFRGSLYEVFGQHLHKAPPSLCARVQDLPPAIEDAVMGTLAKDPQQRFVSVGDFAHALEKAFFATQSLSLGGSIAYGLQDRSTLSEASTSRHSPNGQDSPDDATQPHPSTLRHINSEGEQSVSTQPIRLRPQRKRTGLVIALITLGLVLALASGGIFTTTYFSKIAHVSPPTTPINAHTSSPTPSINAATLSPEQLYDAVTSRPPFYSSNLIQQDTNANWDESPITDEGSCSFANGAYEATVQQGGFVKTCLEQNFTLADFAFQVQMTILSGDNRGGGGLVFRDASDTTMYRFRIGPDGSYDVNSTDLSEVRLSSVINQGLSQTNLLTVIAQGKLLFFYVNKQLIAHTSSSSSDHGRIGFMAVAFSQPADITFSNAEVWKL